jgi:hypothetical protein
MTLKSTDFGYQWLMNVSHWQPVVLLEWIE